MMPTSTKRRILLTAIALGGLTLSGTGCPTPTTKTPGPYNQATMMPYVPTKPFMVAITNSLYAGTTSPVLYAELTQPGSTGTLYWYPLPNNSTTTGQEVDGTTVTVVFGADVYTKPPGSGKVVPNTSLAPGTTVCIMTNVGGDSCPKPGITITPVKVTPCP